MTIIQFHKVPHAVAGACLVNVERQCELAGGEVVLGWSVQELVEGMIEQHQHHVVWRSPDGQLLDLTPTADLETFAPDGSADTIFGLPCNFLPDPTAHFTGVKPNRRALPSKFVPLQDSPAVKRCCNALAIANEAMYSGDYDRAAYWNSKAEDAMRRLFPRLSFPIPERSVVEMFGRSIRAG